MGNACKCVCRQTDEDEAGGALLDGFESPLPQPRGPPPPYQVRAPLYAMTEEQRVQLVQRVTLIQSLPLGRYDVGEDKKDKTAMLEGSQEVQGHEKKGEVDRECPICMIDFSVGEPIRLLPCMHFYHMRCIDEWLMRSYRCPSCMERVDVGLRDTLITSPAHLALRRRRRRRGSASSVASLVSIGAGPGGREAESKRREGTQFASSVSQQAREISGQQQVSAPSPSGHGQERSGHSGGNMNYLTDRSVSGHNSSGQPSSGQVEEATGGQDYEVKLLNDPQTSPDTLAYSMDQITFCNFQLSRGAGSSRQGAPSPGGMATHPDVGVVTTPPLSPPVFEYHFEYPSASNSQTINK